MPNNPDALEVRARFLLLIGRSQEARQCWEEALKLAPNYLYAEHGLGKVAMLEGELEPAIARFEKALSGIPDSTDLVNDLSEAYTRQGEITKAIELLKQSLGHHPDSAATHVSLGQAYLANQQFDLAKEAFEAALKLLPDLPRAQQGLATALVRLGDRQAAQELFDAQKAQRSAGQNRSTDETFLDEITEVALRYQFAARVYQSAGDLVRAEYLLRRAVILKPRSDAAWEPLLGFYRTQGRQAEALATAQEMCEALPNSPSYRYTLGWLLVENQRVDEAVAEFERVKQLAPRSPEGYSALARVSLQFRRGLDQAIELANQAVQLRGSAPDWELLAQAYAIHEKFPDAYQSLQRAIELDPDNQQYKLAMQQLQRVYTPNKP